MMKLERPSVPKDRNIESGSSESGMAKIRILSTGTTKFTIRKMKYEKLSEVHITKKKYSAGLLEISFCGPQFTRKAPK
jgi:hypothetical protein